MDFKLTSQWARDLKFEHSSEVDDNEWKCEKRRKKNEKDKRKVKKTKNNFTIARDFKFGP